MTNVTMKAVDTLHISAVKSDNILPGEEFVASTSIAESLEKRGLATRIGDAPEAEADTASEPAEKPAPAAKPAKPAK